MRRLPEPRWELTKHEGPGFGADTFLPAGMSTAGLLDITNIEQRFRVFYNPDTGLTYDGNVYYQRYLDELKEEHGHSSPP